MLPAAILLYTEQHHTKGYTLNSEGFPQADADWCLWVAPCGGLLLCELIHVKTCQWAFSPEPVSDLHMVVPAQVTPVEIHGGEIQNDLWG